MEGVTIYLADGTFDGTITMDGRTSQFKALRVKKEDVKAYDEDLEGKGIYFLLIGNETVYVGQTRASLNKRILKKHSGTIDSDWHTVVAFICKDATIGTDELKYVENAMCEYVHAVDSVECGTKSPSKSKCNPESRKKNYILKRNLKDACADYIKDIKFYIECFPGSIFPQKNVSTSPIKKEPLSTDIIKNEPLLFHFGSRKRGSDGYAEILTHCGHNKKRKTILKKGSKLSLEISEDVRSKIVEEREKYEKEGYLKGLIVIKDITFKSQSGAGKFLNGTTFDGNLNWTTVKGNKPLKELL